MPGLMPEPVLGRCLMIIDREAKKIRLRLEHRAVERAELQRMCSELRIPGDFDVAQISWRPDYDAFFYRQLSRCFH